MSPPPTIKLAIIAALEQEVRGLIGHSTRIVREHQSSSHTFFESNTMVIIAGGIGLAAARRASEAAIALYHPTILHSVGFAGALDATLHIGEIVTPATIIDARDGSRTELPDGHGALVTFMEVASSQQKASLAQAYSAQLVDMEAAAVAAVAGAHGIQFAVTKVISDDVNFEMPDLSRFIDAQGRIRTASFALYAAVRPWLWPRAAKLASNSSKAAAALSKHLHALSSGPGETSPVAANPGIEGQK